MSQSTKLYKTLAFSGTLPFIFFILLDTLGFQNLPLLENTSNIILSYGLLIISFMAGIHWGIQLQHQTLTKLNLFLLSNFITITSWLVYLLLDQTFITSVYILAFIALLYIDLQLKKNNIITADYYKTRIAVTTIVILSLVLYLF